MEKYTIETFIEKAKKIHKNKYNYKYVKINTTDEKVKIICPIHGEFEQSVEVHLRGSGCKICGHKSGSEKNTYTKIQFLEKSNETHNNKYDYTLVEYVDYKTKVKIICPKHGEFEQRPNQHSNGSGCAKCALEYRVSFIQKTKEDFLVKARLFHGDKYDYSDIEYINMNTKIKIYCKKDNHGYFLTLPESHVGKQKCGCPKCANNRKPTTEEIILKSKLVHGDKYDYSKVNYINKKTKIEIGCSEHGYFHMVPEYHINGSKCPKCSGSSGEVLVQKYLEDKNIKYVVQKTYTDCKNQKKLRFDFYLPDYDILIEFDGTQHFEPKFGEQAFLLTQQNDQIKNDYCLTNNIPLIRIKYSDNLIEKLTNELISLYPDIFTQTII